MYTLLAIECHLLPLVSSFAEYMLMIVVISSFILHISHCCCLQTFAYIVLVFMQENFVKHILDEVVHIGSIVLALSKLQPYSNAEIIVSAYLCGSKPVWLSNKRLCAYS